MAEEAADSTPYSSTLDAMDDAIGEVDTYINSVDPSPAQTKFLAFLQGPMKDALAAARADPDPA